MRSCREQDILPGPGPGVWRVLDKCHHIRNVADSEGTLDGGERIVTDLVAACETVAEHA